MAAASLDAATAKFCRVRRFPLAVLRTQEEARPLDDRLRRAQNVVHHLLDRIGRRRLNFHIDLLGFFHEGRIGDRIVERFPQGLDPVRRRLRRRQ